MGQTATWQPRLVTSYLATIPDIGRDRQHVRDVPITDSCTAQKARSTLLALIARLVELRRAHQRAGVIAGEHYRAAADQQRPTSF
jgi:hypothetical protein